MRESPCPDRFVCVLACFMPSFHSFVPFQVVFLCVNNAMFWSEHFLCGLLYGQPVVTCMTTIRKDREDDSALSCLVVGTEAKEILVLEPATLKVILKVRDSASLQGHRPLPVHLRLSCCLLPRTQMNLLRGIVCCCYRWVQFTLGSVPTQICTSGLYDVEFRMAVSSRSGRVYTIRVGLLCGFSSRQVGGGIHVHGQVG